VSIFADSAGGGGGGGGGGENQLVLSVRLITNRNQ